MAVMRESNDMPVPSHVMSCSLSQMLLTLYSAEGVDDFRTRALSVVKHEFGGELTCHNEINLATGNSLSVLSDSIRDFEKLRPAFFAHVERHPSVQHILKTNGGESSALKTSDFVSQRRWRGSGLYAEFYRPLADVRYQLTIGQRIGNSLVFLAISRRHRDFSEEERARLTALRPHFIQAYRNAEARSELERRCAGANREEAAIGRGEAAIFGLMTRFDLSRREAEVLRELSQSKTNDAIARSLGISLSTVKTRLESVFRQLDVTSRTAAALRALERT